MSTAIVDTLGGVRDTHGHSALRRALLGRTLCKFPSDDRIGRFLLPDGNCGDGVDMATHLLTLLLPSRTGVNPVVTEELDADYFLVCVRPERNVAWLGCGSRLHQTGLVYRKGRATV